MLNRMAPTRARPARNGMTQGAPTDGLFGFDIRSDLYPGEDAYFRSNPTVAGMAAETGDIILNPYAPDDVNRDAVARNEALRLLLRQRGVTPDFDVTDEQRAAFAGTAYETDDAALRQTIAARIYSGDPSAQATERQKAWLRRFLGGLTRKPRLNRMVR